jgi:formylglycine-generating enzyme required for sulfatase activity
MVPISGTEMIPAFYIDRYEYPNKNGVLPIASLSLGDAQELCAEQDKRLCTSAEWRHACLGPKRNRYGYGAEPVSGTCHQSPTQIATHTSMMSNEQFVPSGSFPDCETSTGVVDMIGNLEEWVIDDWKGLGGMLEGGASYTHEIYADCTGRYSRMPDYRLSPTQKIVSAGARCCWSETPVTQNLISLDRRERLQSVQTTEDYDPTNEVQLPHGGWMDRFEYPNREGILPTAGVTWNEAAEYCSQAGKRLCGVYEW